MRGFNEDQIIPFGTFAREEGGSSALSSSCRWKKG
jgi:hypothetical protein